MEEDSITLDEDSEIDIYSDVCSYCRHYRPDVGRHTCAAFPVEDSIPMEIWQGEYDHRQPYPGDNGILFDPGNAHCAAEVAKHFATHVSA